MHDALFAHPRELSGPLILTLARTAGLDMQRFEADLNSAETKAAVARDMQDGDRAGVEGTPSVFINGRKYNGGLDLAAIRPVIDEELKKARQRPPEPRRGRRAGSVLAGVAPSICNGPGDAGRVPCPVEASRAGANRACYR